MMKVKDCFLNRFVQENGYRGYTLLKKILIGDNMGISTRGITTHEEGVDGGKPPRPRRLIIPAIEAVERSLKPLIKYII
jgi:hypothetical protein